MDPRDPIIQRWLNRVHSDAPFRLGEMAPAQPPAGLTDEQKADWRRLLLVEGLLGTLDHRAAPAKLDALVEEAVQALDPSELAAAIDEIPTEWSTDLAQLEAQLESQLDSPPLASETLFPDPGQTPDGRAPEFLDRLVQQKFEAMGLEAMRREALASQQPEPNKRHTFARPLKRVSIVASGLLVLMLMPWSQWFASNNAPQIQLIEYTSFEGLRSAHPDQVSFASRSGEFGTLMGGATASADPSKASRVEQSGGRD